MELIECSHGLFGCVALGMLNVSEHGAFAAVCLAEAEVYLCGEGEPLLVLGLLCFVPVADEGCKLNVVHAAVHNVSAHNEGLFGQLLAHKALAFKAQAVLR